MGATLENESLLLRKTWRELWWRMAKGDLHEYNTIKSTDFVEFWSLYDFWLKKVKEDNKRFKKQS